MLSMLTLLQCPHSYATDDCPDLLCDFDGKCDGYLYECCLHTDIGKSMETISEYNIGQERIKKYE